MKSLVISNQLRTALLLAEECPLFNLRFYLFFTLSGQKGVRLLRQDEEFAILPCLTLESSRVVGGMGTK